MDIGGQAHEAGLEDARIHCFEITRHPGPKSHMRDHVALSIDSRRNFDQLQTLRSNAEYRALGHEERHLSLRTSHARAVANLLELGHELAMSPFLANDGLAVLPNNVQLSRSQRAAEDDAARVLADVDEAADADDPVAEAAHVDVAFRVYLRKRQEGEIESATIVEIELRRLL